MKVLLVDDSRGQRLVQKHVIIECGIAANEIDEAGDGKEALEKLKLTQYGLIVLDWNMPNMDGITFLKILREEGNHTPVIMVTSEGAESNRAEAAALDIVGYLQKPLDPNDFKAMSAPYV